MAITFLTGFEHRAGSTYAANSGVLGSAGTGAYNTSTFRSGAASYRVQPSQTGPQSALVGSGSYAVARIYVRFATLATTESGDRAVYVPGAASGSGTGIFIEASTNKLFARVGGGSKAYGPTISAGQWYRLDLLFNKSTTTWTLSWQVDGAAQTQAALAGQTAGASVSSSDIIGVFNAASAVDAYFDDWAMSSSAGDYPLGAGYVLGLKPIACGTHALGSFTKTGGTSITGGETTSYQEIDEQPPSDADWVAQTAAGTTSYLEYQLTQVSEGNTPRAVRAMGSIIAAAGSSIASKIYLRDGGSDGAVANLAAITTVQGRGACFATRPSGGAWTETAVNAMRMRCGYSFSISTGPIRFPWLFAEVEYGGTAAGPPTVPPTLTGCPTPSPTSDDSATFSWSSSEPGVTQYRYRIDGGAWTTGAGPVTYTGLADGTHTFEVQAGNAQGWGPSATCVWDVDTSVPDPPTITCPGSPLTSGTGSIAFSGEPGATFEVQLDGGGWTADTSPFSFSGLANGDHTLEVRQTDALDNGPSAPATCVFTIAVVPGAPSIVCPPASIDTSDPANWPPVFSWS
jgi:hypothetical protein